MEARNQTGQATQHDTSEQGTIKPHQFDHPLDSLTSQSLAYTQIILVAGIIQGIGRGDDLIEVTHSIAITIAGVDICHPYLALAAV